MTPEEVCEAHDLVTAQSELRDAHAHLVAKPSAWGQVWVGKLEREDRSLDTECSGMMPNGAALAAIDAALTVISARLNELGVGPSTKDTSHAD